MKIAGEDISIATRRSVADAFAWFGSLEGKLTPQQREIAHVILKEINERLGFLHNVGLDYLHLDRTSGTLRAARASASASLRRSAPASRASSTSSTNRRSASTRRTTTASSKR